MAKVTLKDIKIPNTCGECNFIGRYETGLYARNPHCCCELMWGLKEEDYKVDKNSLDENCPLKVLLGANKSWYEKTDLSSIVRISLSDDFIVDYDKSRGMYRVSVFDDGHFWDEFWFDAYEEKEVENIYLVYGNIEESGDTDSWVEAIFDNKEQALSCAEYLNLIKNQENVSYYASGYDWHMNKMDYVEELKKLKDGK